MNDSDWMRQALRLSSHARLLSPPNPWVGCVVVKKDKLVGKGFTQFPGGPHAEVMALQEAGLEAQGSTLFVTLEPCSHWGRTPPCVEAIIRAGVKKAVIGLEDPDPHVKGQGIKRLKEAGIEITTNICAHSIKKSLEPYLYHREYGLPFCTLKSAISLDGKIAAEDQSSQWITDPKTREDAHLLRAYSQAIIVGSTTAALDNPRLTVRHPTYLLFLLRFLNLQLTL